MGVPRRTSWRRTASFPTLLAGFALCAALVPGPVQADSLAPRLVHPVDESDSLAIVEDLRQRIRKDRRDVESRRRLASLLSESRSIDARREAAEALEDAILVDDADTDLWIRLARLRDRQKYHGESRRAYNRAVELLPDEPAVWSELAAIHLYRFQRFHDSDYLRDAAEANHRALRLGGVEADDYKRAVRLAWIANDPSPVDSLLGAWERANPSDPWPPMVRGTLLFERDQWERADREFRTGLNRMPSDLRVEFDRLRIVAPEDEETSSYSPDSAKYVTDFWRWQDPTPADELNPRLLEHYSRMVKSEMFFGRERNNVPGWRHAPGEIVVRYGLPDDWSYLADIARFEFRLFARASYSVPAVNIRYSAGGGTQFFRFFDFAMNGNFVRGLWSGDYFIEEVPSIYDPPFPGLPADQEIEIYRFYDRQGRGRTEVAIALPADEWGDRVLDDPERLLTRVAVYDQGWGSLDQGLRDWALCDRDPEGRLVGLWEFGGHADSLVLGIETEDLDGTARGALYAPLPPQPRDDAGIVLSDVAFVRGIRFPAADGDPYARYGGYALPNPGRRYGAGESVGIGFEVYHLQTDDAGNHDARIAVTVSRRTRRGLLRIALGKGDSRSNELIFSSRAPGSTLEQLLNLSVPDLPKGDYVMRVEVTDSLGGSRTFTTQAFSIVDAMESSE